MKPPSPSPPPPDSSENCSPRSRVVVGSCSPPRLVGLLSCSALAGDGASVRTPRPPARRRRPPWLAAPGQRSQVAMAKVALLLADTGALSADFADVLGKVRTAARKGTGGRWRGKRDGLFWAG